MLFFFAARRVLSPAALVWAVGLFAFSDRVLWHTVEVRPYTIDALAAVGVLAAWLWTGAWPPARRALLFAALVPPLLGLSYPAVFVCAGPGLLLLADAWKCRRVATWLAYGLFLGTAGATCAWLVLGPVRAQHQGMVSAGFDWSNQMPDWTSPGKALVWPLSAVFEVLRYCLRPTGGLLIGFAAAGAVGLVRARRHRLAVLLLAPLLAAMAAACLHKYPCGGGRPMLFMTPAVCLLIGHSVPTFLGGCLRLGSGPPGAAKHFLGGRRLGAGVIALAAAALVLTPMALSLYRLVVPWPRFDCRAAAEYVLSHRRPDDLVAVSLSDEMYYFRHLDPCWRRGRDGPATGDGTRCWATLNLSLQQGPPVGILAQHEAWKVAERKEFGQLVVVLLVRAQPGP
jgi:hypothetical protein